MTDVFAAEAAIVARLRAQVPDLAHVLTVNELAGFNEIGDLLPAAVVMPMGATVTEPPHDGRVQIETQTWQVVLMVGHSQDETGQDTTILRAGALVYAMSVALIGWRPAAGYSTLAYSGRPDPYYEPGYAEFPIEFETVLTFVGAG